MARGLFMASLLPPSDDSRLTCCDRPGVTLLLLVATISRHRRVSRTFPIYVAQRVSELIRLFFCRGPAFGPHRSAKLISAWGAIC